MQLSNVREYIPDIYKGVDEFNEILDVQEKLKLLFLKNCDDVENNQFIETLTLNGIQNYEKILNIISNPANEDLEFRRNRVKNRLTTMPPFTKNFLYDKLNNIIGKDKFNMYIDYDKYTLYIESSADNQNWFIETQITVNSIKPANFVFINKPLISDYVLSSEKINLTSIVHNYKLGTTWILGKSPFSSEEDKGVIKMANISSIQTAFLSDVAISAKDIISSVRINGTKLITGSGLTKTVTGNSLILEYSVTTSDNISEVTLLEFLDSNSNVLTSASVYVPIVSDSVFKHTINFKEG